MTALGGNSMGDHTRRVMIDLLTKELQEVINWTGKGVKQPFKDRRVCKAAKGRFQVL